MGRLTFSPNVNYESVLDKNKQDFLTRWKDMKSSPEIGLRDYEIVGLLGTGVFGAVEFIKHKTSENFCAVKLMQKEKIVKLKQVAHVYNEKNVLSCVQFPFLVSLKFSSKDKESVYLGMPAIMGGELFSFHYRVHKFSEQVARFYASQVFLALEYLHKLSVVYRDLKTENILIDYNGYIKITDFGFAKIVENRTLTLCGTPEYMAPEVILSKPYGTSVDWWAFGVFLYELVAGQSPFAVTGHNVMGMYKKICDGRYSTPAFFSEPLKDLVGGLLQVDLSRRFGNLLNGNSDIKQHEWFKPIHWYTILNQEIDAPFIPTIADATDLSNFNVGSETKLDERCYKDPTASSYSSIFADF